MQEELVIHFNATGTEICSSLRYRNALTSIIKASRDRQSLIASLREELKQLQPSSLYAERSPAMTDVREKIETAARYDTTVLLSGEPGTGKNAASQEIHRLSDRSSKPLNHVYCGAIPKQLIDSELFGHEKGAFAGAHRRHRGLFERTHLGVLVLHEVGGLPKSTQVKLLRVLQEGTIIRVGGESEIQVDVRVLATTHKPLLDMVEAGHFGEDLYYLLHVFPILLPPLRKRQEDLPMLVSQIIDRLVLKLKCEPQRITATDLDNLAKHSWPGNIRELANVLELALVLGQGNSLKLPDFVQSATSQSPAKESAHVVLLDTAICNAIEGALRATNGKIYGFGGAAERLGLPPGTLQSKMRKLGIERQNFLTRSQ